MFYQFSSYCKQPQASLLIVVADSLVFCCQSHSKPKCFIPDNQGIPVKVLAITQKSRGHSVVPKMKKAAKSGYGKRLEKELNLSLKGDATVSFHIRILFYKHIAEYRDQSFCI